MIRITGIVVLLLLSVLTLASSALVASPVEEPMPAGRLGTNVTPLAYALDLTIQPEQDHFSGTARIATRIVQPTRRIWLHGLDLEVGKVAYVQDGVAVPGRYRQENTLGVSSVSFEQAQAGEGELVFEYTAPFHEASALYNLEVDGEHYVFSQLEAIDARAVFPGFDDPRFKTPFKVSVTSAAGNKVVFNSPSTGSQDLGDGNRKHRFAETPPLPTYLLAFAVGPLDIHEGKPLPETALRDREIPLRAVTVKGKGGKAGYALQQTAQVVEALEAYFDVPYPYAKLDLIASPGNVGAMENPGAIVYPEPLLLVDEASSPDLLRWFFYVHAHELAHMWFGDLVTPEWWEDIWLKESFATWMGSKVAGGVRPDLGIAMQQQKSSLYAIGEESSSATRPIQQPIRDNALIRNAFDDVTYQKGAAVLGMVEARVGEDAFRAGVRHHIGRFAHGVANSADFFESMSAGSGKPEIKPILQSFVGNVGAPLVEVAVTCTGDSAEMTVSQSRYRPLGMDYPVDTVWQLPLCYRTEAGQHCETLSAPETTLVLTSCPAYLLPNSQGNGYYRWNLDEQSWAKLIHNRSELSDAELVNVADSVASSFKAGRLDSGTLLELVAMLGKHPSHEVSSQLGGLKRALRRPLLGDAPPDDYRWFVASIYRPRLAALGPEPAPEDSITTKDDRSNALSWMAHQARDAGVRAFLVRKGTEYLEAVESGAADMPIPDDWVGMALLVLAEESDFPALKKLEDLALASTDGLFRRRAFSALGWAQDPDYLERIYADLLPADAVRGQDRMMLLGSLSGNERTRERNFRWVTANLDAVLEGMPSIARSRIADYGSGFCEDSNRTLVADFLASVEDKDPGIARAGRKTLDAIDHCIALRERKSGEFRQALAQAAEAGSLTRPDIEKWVFLGATVGHALAPEDGPGQFSASNPGQILITWMEPGAFDHFKEHRQYADGTTFATAFYNPLENPVPAMDGLALGSLAHLVVHRLERHGQDRRHGFYVFMDGQGRASPAPKEFGCVACHTKHGDLDGTFVQFYPPLRDLLRGEQASSGH